MVFYAYLGKKLLPTTSNLSPSLIGGSCSTLSLMFGRLHYYFSKTRTHYQREGISGALAQSLRFLKRRQFFLQFFFEWFEYRFTSRNHSLAETTLQILKQQPLKAPKILLYASYDLDSVIQDHVVKQLQFFHAQAYQIVFVSTSPLLTNHEWQKIEGYVEIGIHRKNEGYDFASWALAFSFIPEPQILNSLIILNDSCLGPEFDFSSALKVMETQTEVAYGITKTYEIAEYLQSYFIHFGQELLKNGIVQKYFLRIRILKSKWGIVRFFEIGGSRYLSQQGIELRALVDPKLPAIREKMNEFKLTDPVLDPAGTEWVKRRLSPFYKRSNQTGKEERSII